MAETRAEAGGHSSEVGRGASEPAARARPVTSDLSVSDRLQVGLKRLFDIVVALGALVVSLPFWIGASVAVLLETGRPIFYLSTRVGQGGQKFALVKFRSMVQTEEERDSHVTIEGDPRVTRVGAVLRRWRIDELPNLLNVLRGDMSIVGPRPEAPKYVARYTDEQMRVLDVKPGITDVAFVKDYTFEEELLARQEDPEAYYVSHLMQKFVELNLEYIDRYPSLWMDLKILVLSVWTGLFKESLA